MSLHSDTLITTPSGYVSISQLKVGSKVYNLRTREEITISGIYEVEVGEIITILIHSLPPLICSIDQWISTNEGAIKALDVCSKCNIITALGIRRPLGVNRSYMPSVLYRIEFEHENPEYLANGIYVLERR